MNLEQQSWQTSDGLEIHASSWAPESASRGLVCLVHGLGEHSGRYDHVATRLAQGGYVVLAADLRGHGKSGGPRGFTPSYPVLLDDIAIQVDQAKQDYPGLPVFLYGHSLGGGLVLQAALQRRPEVAGVVSTGPSLRLPFDPPAWKVAVGRVSGWLMPSFSQASGLDTTALSRDPKVESAYIHDPLVHDRISARLFFGFVDAGAWVLEHAAELAIPVLLMHGSEDRLTSMPASCEFAARAGGMCTLKIWEGGYHEVHNDLEKEQVIAAMLSWLDEHS